MKISKVKSYVIDIIAILLIVTGITITIINCDKGKNQIIQLSPQGISQMMGYIIKTENNQVIVIDGGTVDDTDNLVKKIQENGSEVKAWFLTHAHNDHVGAFTKIVNETDIKIDKVYKSFNEYSWYEQNEPARAEFTKYLLDTLENDKIKNHVEEATLNQTIEIDNVKVEILGVKNPEITENPGNEQSMVIKFNFQEKNLLILGDTGINNSKKLLTNQKEKLKSDIVQMAHHGQQGATEELYKEINPTICLWPTTDWLWDNNNFGEGYNTGPWKTLETREWIEKLNVKTNYIAKDGDITIKVK